MKQVLESSFPSYASVEKIELNQEEKALYVTVHVSSVMPQKVFDVQVKVFHPSWEVDSVTGKLNTKKQGAKFDIIKTDFTRIYPTDTFETEGIDGDTFIRFLKKKNKHILDEIAAYLDVM